VARPGDLARASGVSLDAWVAGLPLLFASSTALSRDVATAGSRGLVRKVGPKLYTTDVTTPLETLVTRNAIPVASLRFPGAVVSHRSAFEMRPVDGHLFLTGAYEKTDRLPGMTIRLVQGPGPADGDMPLMDLYRASDARAYLENLRRTRRAGGVSRVLERAELERRLEHHLRDHGEAGLNALRDDARAVAGPVGLEAALPALEAIVGALLRTREATLTAPAAVARAASAPFDAERIALFETLADALRAHPEVPRPAGPMLRDERQHLALVEAYFSNYIEGTRFTVEEAVDIIVDGAAPAGRPEDGRDVTDTYELLVDDAEMTVSATDFELFEDFEALLKRRHYAIMGGRPETRPGAYKVASNQAGQTRFVAPELVRGTLERGFAILRTLETPFQRAAFVMFLVAEVHPFTDGNGRLARAMMNAELSAADETRVLVATAYRTDYLGALRRLSRKGDPNPYLRMLDRAQNFSSRLDFGELQPVLDVLRACNAFDDSGKRILRLPPPR